MEIYHHYKNIADRYDYFYQARHLAMAPIFIKELEMNPDDHFLDLGAATGKVASIIRHAVGLKNPVTCVEPCDSFLKNLSKLDGIDVVHQTAERFYDELFRNVLKEKMKVPFSKVLISAALHHFHEPCNCLDKIIDLLPKGGIFINAELATDNFNLPFTRKHLDYISTVPTLAEKIVPHLKRRHDIVTEQRGVSFSYKIKKGRWCDMIRGRFMSYFKEYTDENLEGYIQDLEEERFGRVGNDDEITVQDNLVIVKCVKTM